ncbi:DNA polymerase III alpha subunit [Escherichia coli ISC41]|nr:DNA polymerase III alpha subunit [Escherichia coli ISC41]
MRLGEYFLPQFPTGDMSTEDYLVKRAKEGLEERLAFLFPDEEERLKRRPEYDERLDTELQVINQMGFPGYFLIVMEFIQWSKDNGVPVGPGRGSGAGSLVAYALKITDLDPLEFDLLFERFLNPERVSMPDFDVDFCMEKRDRLSNMWRTCTVAMRYRRLSPSVRWRRKR